MEMLSGSGFKFLKSMGQSFLIDKNIPEKIVRLSGLDRSCGVLEVGPGSGILTAELCKYAGRVTSVELDNRLLPILYDSLSAYSNVDIVHGDILKLDIRQLLSENMPGMIYHVCANLPYNITTPALTSLISSGVFETITVMVQREVAKRICASPGSPSYGAFTVFVNYYSQPETLFDVPPECFMPRPKVYSSVVRISLCKEKRFDQRNEAVFFRVVRAAFGQRRKTLVNALFSVFGNTLTKSDIEGIVRECGFDPRTRGETLSIDEFARLSMYFN